MRVELPKEKYAVIIAVDDLSEGACRLIDRAMYRASAIRVKIADAGLDPDAVTLGEMANVLTDDELESVKGYNDALIVNMVTEWDVLKDLPTLENITTVSRQTFEAIAKACNEEWGKATDFSSAGAVDPKADGGNSVA
jgi:hypothetical protein